MKPIKELILETNQDGTYVYNFNDPHIRKFLLKSIVDLEKKIEDLKK